jgi:hypothetical protein
VQPFGRLAQDVRAAIARETDEIRRYGSAATHDVRT